ncbi:hypothetical protein [Conexibacter woesei]|uniref:Uncharacterized protein n=1 Tax=Conexibacter woesei (strain DSM 14684 / CCUG 47730 / CIP 108061 / JCM 11494 / NBRC 100937 / ID131577) TaxID=469383 RepID=D3F690_CONWI|nr:hypothetical protein [Conexibacter woesei]ADB48763.1 hypothetical protein Cwoe_0327 [Conexibacter woesei DSM 14684]
MTARQPIAALLAVLAVLCALVGGVSVYVRDQVVDRPTFVDRARDALDRDPVRQAVTSEIAARVRERIPGALVSSTQLDRAVDAAVSTRAFRRAFRRTAADANRVLFDPGGGTATLDLGDVAPALDAIDPRLSQALAGGASTRLLQIRSGSLGIGSARIADAVDTLAGVLPPAAAVAFVLALLVAADRRRTLRVVAVATVAAGALLLLGLALGRSLALDRVDPGGVLTPEEAKRAAGAVWDVYTDDLRPWALAAIGAGLALTVVTLIPWGRARRDPA